MKISQVSNAQEIEITARLAKKIWNQHYVPIIGQSQVDYMLKKFQSKEAIQDQIDSGYEYFLLTSDDQHAGYLGLIPDEPQGKLMISKIYIDPEARGRGYGNELLKFSLTLCKKRAFKAVWLTVNKNNSETIAWYKKRGFSIIEAIKMDIGNNYFMDDYVMELPMNVENA